MYFKQFLNEAYGCASYLIASRQSNEAVVVDPSLDSSQYDDILTERGYTLRYVIDTHVHADHVSGARQLARRHNAQFCMHESANVSYPFQPLADGEELPLGQLRLRVMHTPGHRPELMSLLVINPLRSDEPSMVLTGDSLLVGDVGRPDFGGGDATAQYSTLRRLMELPDWVAVFPGHFEGPCGKGMCGRPSTTIGFERRFNPMALLNRDAFLEEVSEVPARPLNMIAIEATNRGVAHLDWAMPIGGFAVPEIDIAQMEQELAASPAPLLLDVREPEEYAQGHVPGAINLPQAELAQRLDELDKDQPVLVICEAGMRSLNAARFLKQVGYSHAVSVQGGTAAWRMSRQTAS
jgi:glyoxylase-like metal-dependent hydrolase (beta-lactamase superfamily II)/rhodanese-related sulfurtransferase